MIKEPSVAIIIPPHAEPSMPMLGAAQLFGYAKKQGIPANYYDFSIYAKTGGDVLPYFSETEALYWKSVNAHKKFFSERYASLFPFFSATWDGCEQGNLRWNFFDDQKEYIDRQRGNNALVSLFSRFSGFYDHTYFLISVTFPSQLFDALLIAYCIRKNNTEAIIVFGGGLINSCIQNQNDIRGSISDLVDFISLGEGEFFIKVICLYSAEEIKKYFSEKCFGISHIVDSELLKRKLVLNIQLNPPAFDDLQAYDTPLTVLPYRLYSTCYWNRCSFCTEHSYKSILQTISVEEHVGNLLSLKREYKTHFFMLQDSAIHPSILNKFCDLLLQSGEDIKWGVNARFDVKLTDVLLEKMRAAGCLFLRFGMESGSERVLRLMNKGISIDESKRVLRKARALGILTHCYFIVGFPGENTHDRALTRKFILDDNAFPDSFNISTFISYRIAPINGATEKCACTDECWDLYVTPQFSSYYGIFIDELTKEFELKHPIHKTLLSPAHTLTLYEKTRRW